jgi:hypothetical protein
MAEDGGLVRQRSDPLEMPGALGPLFARNDPPTSRKAAEKMAPRLTDGQEIALDEIRDNPGSTVKELGVKAARYFSPPDAEYWRQRIGRRLNELEKAGLIRRDGERDGCAIWWPVTP